MCGNRCSGWRGLHTPRARKYESFFLFGLGDSLRKHSLLAMPPPKQFRTNDDGLTDRTRHDTTEQGKRDEKLRRNDGTFCVFWLLLPNESFCVINFRVKRRNWEVIQLLQLLFFQLATLFFENSVARFSKLTLAFSESFLKWFSNNKQRFWNELSKFLPQKPIKLIMYRFNL